jgi:hypothetical protein
MRDANPLSRWNNALSTYLSSRRALGRAYRPEEAVLRNVRRYLVGAVANAGACCRMRCPLCAGDLIHCR